VRPPRRAAPCGAVNFGDVRRDPPTVTPGRRHLRPVGPDRSVQRAGHPQLVDIPGITASAAAAVGAAATARGAARWTVARARPAAPNRIGVPYQALADHPLRWAGPGTAAVGAALLALTATHPTDLAAIALLVGVGAVLTVTDLRWQLLPDRVTGPTFLLLLLLAGVHAAATHSGAVLLAGAIQGGIAAGVLLCFFVLVEVILNRGGGPGLGDVKLAGLLGFALGALSGPSSSPVWWPVQALQLLVLGELATVALGLFQRARRGRWGPVPAGPGLLAAAAALGALGTLGK